jgi:hypothetical protein
MTGFVAGALAMAYLVAATFFLRFWRESRDRLFLLFGAAFLMLTVQRVLLTAVGDHPTASLALYGLRLVAFLVILAAILDKNRAGR